MARRHHLPVIPNIWLRHAQHAQHAGGHSNVNMKNYGRVSSVTMPRIKGEIELGMPTMDIYQCLTEEEISQEAAEAEDVQQHKMTQQDKE